MPTNLLGNWLIAAADVTQIELLFYCLHKGGYVFCLSLFSVELLKLLSINCHEILIRFSPCAKR